MAGRTVISAVVMLLLCTAAANAFGISYQYLENNTLNLYPGQNYLFKLTIQNKDDEEINANISLQSDLATLLGGPVVYVPARTYDTFVYFNITIPEDAKINDNYSIKYVVSPVGNGEGQVPLSVRYDRTLKITVVDRSLSAASGAAVEMPKDMRPTSTRYIPILAIVALVAVMIILLVWRKSSRVSKHLLHEKTAENNPEIPAVPEVQAENPAAKSAGHVHKPETEDVAKKIRRQKNAKTISPEEYFYLKGGKVLKNLSDLKTAISTITEEEFLHHVNENKNDFAEWVTLSLGDESLGKKIYSANSRQDLLELVENENNA
jgi:hypothetical protein